MQPTTKGGRLKSVTVVTAAAASYEDEAAAVVGNHGGDDDGVAATTSLHRVVADDGVALTPELRVVGGRGALCSSPKGRPAGPTREDDGGGKTHDAAAPTFVKRARGPTPPCLPAEGSGGNGGCKH